MVIIILGRYPVPLLNFTITHMSFGGNFVTLHICGVICMYVNIGLHRLGIEVPYLAAQLQDYCNCNTISISVPLWSTTVTFRVQCPTKFKRILNVSSQIAQVHSQPQRL